MIKVNLLDSLCSFAMESDIYVSVDHGFLRCSFKSAANSWIVYFVHSSYFDEMYELARKEYFNRSPGFVLENFISSHGSTKLPVD